MKEIADIIVEGLGMELRNFFSDLNWYYIIMLSCILYGITYKKEFEWYVGLCRRLGLGRYREWIGGLIVGIIFCFFRWKGVEDLDSEYVASLLRSWFLVVIFANIIIDGIVRFIKFMGKKVDDSSRDVG